MKWLRALILLTLPLTVSANTLLECHHRDSKFGFNEVIIGNVAITSDELILFQLIPYFETVSFDLKNAVQETGRTGSWTTYTEEREFDQIITLQLEDSGSVRRGYLTRESVPFADDYFYEIIPLKCLKR